MKKIVLSSLLVLSVATCSSIRATPAPAADTSYKFSFMVISDIHTPNYNSSLTDALKESATHNCSALCVVGDLTNNGTDEQYDQLMSIMNSNPHPPAYYVVGNHDVRWLAGGYTEAQNRFLAKTGMPGMYYDQWIKGYHFIFLATEQDLKDQAYLSDTQLSWLDSKLADQAAADKPTFVFLHQPLVNTIRGTYPTDGYGQSYPDGVVQDTALKGILAKYPQTILLTGHTHYAVTNTNLYDTMYCNMINDGAIVRDQGMIVDVYNNRVVIKGRNFATGKTLASWTVNYSLPAFNPGISYKLVNHNSFMPMDVQGASLADGARIIQNSDSGGASQQWSLTNVGGGYFNLLNIQSGKLLGVQGSSTSNSAAILQNAGTGGLNQQWVFKGTGNGYYKLINRNSGKVIDVSGSSTNSGIGLIQYTDNLGGNQQWKIAPVFDANAYYKIVSRSSGKVIGLKSGSAEDEDAIVQHADDGKSDQEWRIVDVGGGFYSLICRQNGKAADIQDASVDNRAAAVQADASGELDQQWSIDSTGDGYFKLVNRNSEKLLEIPDNLNGSNEGLVQLADDAGANQQWKIVKVK